MIIIYQQLSQAVTGKLSVSVVHSELREVGSKTFIARIHTLAKRYKRSMQPDVREHGGGSLYVGAHAVENKTHQNI